MSSIQELIRPFIHREFGPAVSNPGERLAEFKQFAPGKLPLDYEKFLLLSGRAVGLQENHVLAIDLPRPRLQGMFTYIGPNPPIDRLYGLQESHYDVFQAYDWYKDQIPPGLISIGEDMFGNQICMDIAGPAPYTIWHWFHEGEESFDENGRPGYANMFRLAYNFTDLLQRLRLGDYEEPGEPKPNDAPVKANICYIAPGFEEEIRRWNEQEEQRRAEEALSPKARDTGKL